MNDTIKVQTNSLISDLKSSVSSPYSYQVEAAHIHTKFEAAKIHIKFEAGQIHIKFVATQTHGKLDHIKFE